MLPGKLLTIFRKEAESASPATALPWAHSNLQVSPRKNTRKEFVSARHSRGLEQFFFNIRDMVGLSILDLAGANQQNIDFLTNLGHKVYSQDMTRNLDDAFGIDPAEQTNAGRIEYFLKQNFDYRPDTFEGILLWDSLQFMGPALLAATIEKLFEVMHPKAYLLGFFTANERAAEVPSYAFRITTARTIEVTERGVRPIGHVFNNRSIEKLFGRFESVKFFLTRENLREVIVRK